MSIDKSDELILTLQDRVRGLLEANNREVERRRIAEGLLYGRLKIEITDDVIAKVVGVLKLWNEEPTETKIRRCLETFVEQFKTSVIQLPPPQVGAQILIVNGNGEQVLTLTPPRNSIIQLKTEE